MADQSATAVYDPSQTSPDQLISAFAEAKSSSESRFTLASLSGDAAGDASDGEVDSSNDFAPPLPPSSPEFGGSESKTGSAPPEPSGGDFEVSLEAPAE